MKRIISSIVIGLAVIVLVVFSVINWSKKPSQTVIVSLDGFRISYLDSTNTPFLWELAQVSTFAEMAPSFPSITFPNHYTLATGLRPEHNGIIGNTFYNYEKKDFYKITNANRHNPDYYKGEPIWNTAAKQDVKVGSLYWVGADAAINGMKPFLSKEWSNHLLTFGQRVDTTISWLTNQNCRLVMTYFEEPDGVGHKYGPYGKETKKMVHSLDSLMAILYQEIKQLPNGDNINLIILSDHGMAAVPKENNIEPENYIKNSWITHLVGNIPTMIYAEKNCTDSIYNALKDVEHLYVWKRADIPDSLQFSDDSNIGDILVLPEIGWQFSHNAHYDGGAHGFAPQNVEMHVPLIAYGPDFKDHYQLNTIINNTCIYPMTAKIIGVKANTNDGENEPYKKLLK
ncbi:MAG: nucleotide pyrophosphatase/phosphodiesterase family protein [Bacteroidales bacterium]